MKALNVFLWHVVIIMMFAAARMYGFFCFTSGIVFMYWCAVFLAALGSKNEQKI